MSFPNTHTPTRAEIVGKARYQVPMHKVRGVDAYYLTPELEAHFRRLFPVTLNRDMMRLFGISFVTMQRFKRQLGLQKKMRTIRHKQAQIAKQICEQNGWYDSLRGKAPSEACLEAARAKRESGFHPWRQLKKTNPRKYKRLMAQKSEDRKTLLRRERIRVNNGFEQLTKLHVPYYPFSRRKACLRCNMKKAGYIVGNARSDDRMNIYYTADTVRCLVREQHAVEMGFNVALLTQNDPK